MFIDIIMSHSKSADVAAKLAPSGAPNPDVGIQAAGPLGLQSQDGGDPRLVPGCGMPIGRGMPLQGSLSKRPSSWSGYTIPKKSKPSTETSPAGFSSEEDSDDSDFNALADVSILAPSGNDFTEDRRPSLGPSPTGKFDFLAQPSVQGLSDNSIFDPLTQQLQDSGLDYGQREFLFRYLVDPNYCPDVIDKMADDYPIPDEVSVATQRQIDPEILAMLPSGVASKLKDTDKNLASVGNRLNTALGPMLELWNQLREARNQGSHVPPADACGLIERSLVALGQVHGNVLFARRKLILGSFFKDNRKATEAVKLNLASFQQEPKWLFGTSFHRALHRKAKGSKMLREARQELQKSFRPKNKTFGQANRSRPATATSAASSATSAKAPSKPFRGGPPSRGRGGGRGRGQTQSRYVSSSYPRIRYFRSYDGSLSSFRCARRNLSIRSARACTGASRRQPSQTPPKLEGSDHRPMGVECDSGISGCLDGPSHAVERAHQPQDECSKVSVTGGRTGEITRERGHRTSDRGNRTVHQFLVPPTQERRFDEAYPQSETPQSVPGIRTFQDGEPPFSDRHDSEGGVLCQTRSERCLLLRAGRPGNQEIFTVSMGTSVDAIQSVPFRPSLCAAGFHEIDETSSGPSETSRNEGGDLSGRHDFHESKSSSFEYSDTVSQMAVRKAGFPGESKQVCTDPIPNDRISGVFDRFVRNENLSAGTENAGHSESVPYNDRETGHDCSRTSSPDRQVSGSSEGGSPRTFTLSQITNAEDSRVVVGQPQLRVYSTLVSRMQGRAEVVEPGAGNLERSIIDQTLPRLDLGHNNGCVQKRLGGSVQWGEDPGDLVFDRAKPPHQCAGDESGVLCIESFCQRPNRDACPPSYGQQSHSGEHQQDGNHQVSGPVTSDPGDLAILSISLDHSYGGISAGVNESDSRSGVQTIHGPEQLEAGPEGVSPVEPALGTTGYGPVCRQVELSDTAVCQLETRPRSDSDRRIHHELEVGEGLCVSSFLPDQQMSSEGAGRRGRTGSDNTNLDDAALVCQTITNDGRNAHIVAQLSEHNNRASGSEPPNDADGCSPSSGLENIRENWRAQGFSEEAVNIMGESRRKGTKSAYECAWRKWTSWCAEQQVDPFHTTLANVINFLSHSFQERREYATLNTYRSAISAYHPRIEGWKVGQHPQIMEFMRGVFNRRPPIPKYTDTWNVDIVLQYIRQLGNSQDLSDKLLTLKTTMLLGLTNAGRAQEIQSLNPNLMQDYGNRLVFPIARLTKVKRPAKPTVSFELLQFDGDELLDVVQCVRIYLERTRNWRTTISRQEQLLLAIVRPHNPVAVSTVSRWLKELMGLAGIDTDKYKGHSVRSAATSKNMTLGLNISQILERANWSKANTFYRFYYRDIVNTENSFQIRVLQSK